MNIHSVKSKPLNEDQLEDTSIPYFSCIFLYFWKFQKLGGINVTEKTK